MKPNLSVKVAQIFNLLYRRFAIGRVGAEINFDSARSTQAGRQQVKNLRYSRLKICATYPGRPPKDVKFPYPPAWRDH